MTIYTITIEVEVHDEQELFDAAVVHYQDINGGEAETISSAFKSDDVIDVRGCLIQLFDPGLSPPGVDIIDSSVD